MSYDDVIATSDDGKLRVILEQDQDCEKPMDSGDWWSTSVLTPAQRGDYRMVAEYDPENRLAVWQDFNTYRQVPDADAAFIRYMRIFHDTEVFETGFGSYGTRALAWLEASERDRLGIPASYPAREAVDSDVDQHNMWANGECYGYRVQRLTTWAVVPEPDGTEYRPGDLQPVTETRQTWEDTDESCWGFIGREYAEQEATEALAGFRD